MNAWCYSSGRMTCLKCFHIFSVIGLPPALRFLWAGVSMSDMAATVTVSRTAANYRFRTDCLRERERLQCCAKQVSHISPAGGRRRRPCETFRTVSQCESFAFRTTPKTRCHLSFVSHSYSWFHCDFHSHHQSVLLCGKLRAALLYLHLQC